MTALFHGKPQKGHLLLFFLLPLALLLGGCSDKAQQETRLFMPVKGAYWGMSLADAEKLLTDKGYTYEKISSSEYGYRLKITGDCKKPFGLDNVEEIWLLCSSDRDILMGSTISLSSDCDETAAKNTLVKRFGEQEEERDGDSVIYSNNSKICLKDFSVEAGEWPSNFHGLGSSSEDLRTEARLSGMRFIPMDDGTYLISIDARWAAVLRLAMDSPNESS